MKRIQEENTPLVRMQEGELRLRGLLLKGLAGEELAYREFLKGLSAHLRAYFRRRLSSLPDEIEDLVQDTLLAIHNQRHTYREDLPVTAWAHAIARYKLIDLFRSRAVRENLHDPLDDDLELFASSDTDAADARHDVASLLEQLPANQRLPLIHTKLEGLSVAEAAQASGMSESAIKVGVHRGLKALAALMKEAR